jgi:hypothetical protein
MRVNRAFVLLCWSFSVAESVPAQVRLSIDATDSVDLLRIPLKLSTQSGEVVHPRSEATLELVHPARGGQHDARTKCI